jgi:cytochrome c peroxidase
MRNKPVLASALAGTMVVTTVAIAQDQSLTKPQFCSAQINITSYLPGGANEDPDVAAANAYIDKVFAAAQQEAQNPSALDLYHQVTLLGTLGLYDKNLSVNKNLACTSCHIAYTGFTGGVSLFNQTIVAQPGSVPITNATPPHPNTRLSQRKPQSYGYAPFSPVLQFDATQMLFTGGNFWDMRATGLQLGNPAAEQAEGPPVNPVEMGNPDTACVVYALSQSSYRALFEQVWGAQSFAITWPADVQQVCAMPGPPPASDPLPVHLSAVDRGTSTSTFQHLVLSMAAYEASPDVSPFSSKFDYQLAHPTQQVLSPDEAAGYQLFRGKGFCNTCHLDGTQNTAGGKTPRPPSQKGNIFSQNPNSGPFLTDFQPHNLGLPGNYAEPWYCENVPDQYGYVANPLGQGYVDYGFGAFLAGNAAAPNPNQSWAQYAPQFNGTFQTATLRNVDKRPRPDFVKAYMHNGFLKSLKEVVHFYNTRDVLPTCPGDPVTSSLDPNAGKTCWPAPAVTANEDKTIGNLGLTDHEEDLIVAFLQTLTDGYMQVSAPGDAIGASIGTAAAPSAPSQ